MSKFYLIFVLTWVAWGLSGAIPHFTVTQNKSPIKIDGQLDQNEWQNAVILRNFRTLGERNAVQEPTTVQIKFDQHNLYLGFTFMEYALRVESNQLKSFKRNLLGRRKPIWEDDALEIRFQPPGLSGAKFFYYGFNSNGATFNLTPPGVDSTWDQKVQLRTKLYNGWWTAEVAIPFSAVAVPGKKWSPLGQWRINFVRFEQRIPETSSWCTLNAGEHNTAGKLAQMTLTREEVPQVQEESFDNAAHPENLAVKLVGIPWQGKWQTVAYWGTEKLSRSGFARAEGQVKWTIARPDMGQGSFYCRIGNFYQSPRRRVEISGGAPQVKVQGIGKIVLNDRKVSECRLPVTRGKNKLQLELAPGSAAEINWNSVVPVRLKWRLAGRQIERVGEIHRLHNTTSQRQQYEVTFRYQSSSFLPSGIERSVLHLTRNGTYLVDWSVLETQNGDWSQPLTDLELNLWLPEEVELLGVASREKYPAGLADLNWPAEKNLYFHKFLGLKNIRQRQFRHYRVWRNRPVQYSPRYKSYHRHHQVTAEKARLFVRCNSDDGKKMRYLYFSEVAQRGELVEIPRQIPVQYHPALAGKINTQLDCPLFLIQLEDIANPQLTTPFYQTLQSAGINSLIYDSRFAPLDGMKTLSMIYFETVRWRNNYPDIKPLLKKFPEARSRNARGNPTGALSLSYILAHPETHGELEQIFVRLKKQTPWLNALFWDFEDNPFTGIHTGDYSPCALQRFRQRHKITGPLTAEIIRQRYGAQWTDFRGWELGEFTRLIRPMLKRQNFELTFYSDYDSPQAIDMYTLNWQYLGGEIDCAYMGYGRDVQQIVRTKRKLKNTPAVFGLLTSPYSATYERSLILRRLIDSQKGVLFWYERGIGALELQEFAAVSKFYHQYANFFQSGVRCDHKIKIGGILPDNVIVYEYQNNYLVIILNDTTLPQKALLPVRTLDAMSEIFTQKPLSASRQIIIPPKQAVAFCAPKKVWQNVAPTVMLHPGNLLKNSSFETENSWKSSVYIKGKRSQNFASDGKFAGLIHGDGARKHYAFTQELPVKALQEPNLKLQASIDVRIEQWHQGVVYPLYLIISTREPDGTIKSNYPRAAVLNSTSPRKTWFRLTHIFDLSSYRNIVRAEFMILGWNYQKKYFSGDIYFDNVVLEKIKVAQ